MKPKKDKFNFRGGTSPMHPAGDEPRLSNEQRHTLLEKFSLDPDEAERLRHDHARANRKIGWAIGSNLPDRESSAMATAEAIDPTLKKYIAVGVRTGHTQRRRASEDRDPLNALIDQPLKVQRSISSTKLWDHLCNVDEIFPRWGRVKTNEEDEETLFLEWSGGDCKREGSRLITRSNFRARVSLRRKALGIKD